MVNEIGDSQGLALSRLEGDNCTDIDSHADHAGMVAGCCRACRAESRATSNRIETDFLAELSNGQTIPLSAVTFGVSASTSDSTKGSCSMLE
jgi:hypothetical protein